MAGNPNCPKKIETREHKKLQTNSLAKASHASNRIKWTGDSALHLYDRSITSPALTTSNPGGNVPSLELLDKIHLNIQSILQQQSELNKFLSDLTLRQTNQAKEIVNVNQVLNEVVCPLLKEVTHVIYTQANSRQIRPIEPFYSKLINYLNRKDINCMLSNISFESQSSKKQIQGKATISSNSLNFDKKNESDC